MIGSMQHRITAQNPKRVSNGRGGWALDYAAGDSIEVWAAAELLSINQQLRYNSFEDVPNMRFEIRNNPFISGDTRLVFNGDPYKITQIAPVPDRPHFTEIRAREV